VLESLNSPVPAVWIVLLRVTVGLIWLRAGLSKVLHREYLEYEVKLRRFISKNPISWYRGFLERCMLPYSRPAGYFFVTAEVCLGVLLTLGLLTLPAALIGAFFNLNFRLAAGWQSPSNPTLNYLMIICQLLVAASDAGAYLSLDAVWF